MQRGICNKDAVKVSLSQRAIIKLKANSDWEWMATGLISNYAISNYAIIYNVQTMYQAIMVT